MNAIVCSVAVVCERPDPPLSSTTGRDLPRRNRCGASRPTDQRRTLPPGSVLADTRRVKRKPQLTSGARTDGTSRGRTLDAPILSNGTNQARRGSKRQCVKRKAHRPTHRGARVIGVDALHIVLISPEPSDGQERKQDNKDDPNINAHQSSPAAGSVRHCVGGSSSRS